MRFVVERGGPGTRLVFTFTDAAFETETTAARVARAGFTSFSELDGGALWRRHLPCEPPPTAWVIRVGTACV